VIEASIQTVVENVSGRWKAILSLADEEYESQGRQRSTRHASTGSIIKIIDGAHDASSTSKS
jgi:hypothetical protein